MTCVHSDITSINQYELIRKYQCSECNAVMMCNCDEEIGRKFLPHQLARGTSYKSKEEIYVTHGFQHNVCSECRGLSADCYPVASIFGRTSNIKRYYWRELAFKKYEIYEQLGGDPSAYFYEREESEIIQAAKSNALEAIKALHAENPKYEYIKESNEAFLKRLDVPLRQVEGNFVRGSSTKAQIQYQDELLSVEQYASRIYQNKGYKVLELESIPIHALFGVFAWVLIEDPDDPKIQLSGFGERSAYELDGSKNMIWAPLPSDFGADEYGERRAKAIERHFSDFGESKEDLLWLFDYWVPYSEGLRQYLWAHRQETVQRARKLVEVLEPDTIIQILKYLLNGYWRRYLGWPDLLVYNSESYLFVEVKLSKDKLSEDQRRWIEDNQAHLKLPYEILKVNRVVAQQNHADGHHSATLRAGG